MMGINARFLLVALVVLVPIAALVYRVESGAKDAWTQAVQAEIDGRLDEAVYHYQRSAKWNSLITQTSEDAQDKLRSLTDTAEANGAKKLALLSQRYLRASFMSTNHLWRQDTAALGAVNRRIARLTAEVQLASGAPTIRGRTLETLTADHLTLLERRYGPTPLQGSLVFMLFLAWIGAAIWTVWRGLNADGKVNRNQLVRGALATLVLFTSFCLTLSSV